MLLSRTSTVSDEVSPKMMNTICRRRSLEIALNPRVGHGTLAQSVCSFGTLMTVKGLVHEPLAMSSLASASFAKRTRRSCLLALAELQ
jgi:hypothetical protein